MNIALENIVPVGARIIIQAIGDSTRTESGLEMAEKEHSGTPVMGKVIQSGDESKFKVGQIIMFRRYSVDEMKLTTQTGEIVVQLVEDDEVVAIINEVHEQGI